MKKMNWMWLCAAALVMGFSSCENEPENETVLVTFENVELSKDGFWNGSDLSGEAKEEVVWGDSVTSYYGSFESGNCSLKNVYTVSNWPSWKGAACSNLTDSVTAGSGNQYSVYVGSGAAGSKNFALMFDQDATIEVQPTLADKKGTTYPVNARIKSIALTNSTYVYRVLAYGDDFCKDFEEGDYFVAIIEGKLDGVSTGKVEYYAADYRDGKRFINKAWETVDVSALGVVDELVFTFDGTDKGQFGLNTPTYICVDNIEFEYEL